MCRALEVGIFHAEGEAGAGVLTWKSPRSIQKIADAHRGRRGMDTGLRVRPHSCRWHHGENKQFPATWDNMDIAQQRSPRSQACTTLVGILIIEEAMHCEGRGQLWPHRAL